MNITKKNILFFILGLITYFVVDMAFNWNENVNDFKRGWQDGINGEEYNYSKSDTSNN